jgi:hypothetical protein
MPEIRYPGVYIVKTEATAKPIPGVSLSDRTLAAIVADVRRHLKVLAPEWTDRNSRDPGVTLVELLAWVAEQLLHRADAISDEMFLPTSRLTALLLAALADTKAGHCGALKQLQFYEGRHFGEFVPDAGCSLEARMNR